MKGVFEVSINNKTMLKKKDLSLQIQEICKQVLNIDL